MSISSPAPASRRRSSSPPACRPAARHELRALRDVMARAFWDDPLHAWMLPDPRTRYPRLRAVYGMELTIFDRKGSVFTTDDLTAAAAWAPPGHWKITAAEAARVAHLGLAAFGLRWQRPRAIAAACARVHPVEPHWYLSAIGTDPARQGTGAGRAVLEAGLSRADSDGVGTYLESSAEGNLAFYERFGFRVTSEERVDGGGPAFWPMWRDPT